MIPAALPTQAPSQTETANPTSASSEFKRIFDDLPVDSDSLPSPWDLFEEPEEGMPPLPALQLTPAPFEGSIAHVTELFFETMVNEVHQLIASKDTHTTFFLTAPNFKNSPFYGTKITIREFSTAPKAFNIEIATSPLAIAHLQVHQSQLMHALAQHKDLFSVHQLDLHLNTEDKPLFHRKPAAQSHEELT